MGMFNKASKKKQKLRILIESPSGHGKTYSALRLAKGLGGKIAVIDTEHGSASLYADKFDFDVCELNPPYSPNNYILTINEAEKAGYDVCIIDSLSHEWSGQGGCIEMQSKLGGRFTDWATVIPQHIKLIERILDSKMHIICTARTKSDWSMEINEKGKVMPQKVGLKTEQRDGTDFEFTTVFRLNPNHIASCTKDRTGLFDGLNEMIDESFGQKFNNWLDNTIDVEPVNKQVFDIEWFKNNLKRLLQPGQIKLFMKQNGMSLSEPEKILEIINREDYSLDLAIAEFLDQVEK